MAGRSQLVETNAPQASYMAELWLLDVSNVAPPDVGSVTMTGPHGSDHVLSTPLELLPNELVGVPRKVWAMPPGSAPRSDGVPMARPLPSASTFSPK
jgi:hypothetical protein